MRGTSNPPLLPSRHTDRFSDTMAIGIDIGTTNSVLALASGGQVRLAEFQFQGDVVSTFRSVLYIPESEEGQRNPRILTGPEALEAYLNDGGGGRMLSSPKSFLATSFSETQIGQRKVSLEELLSYIIRDLRQQAEMQFGSLEGPVVVGRPVRFVQHDREHREEYALTRLEKAFALAGFSEVHFEYEPIAAAYTYQQHIRREEIVFVADFGGGTSDFCLFRAIPQGRQNPNATDQIISIGGIGLAGDSFDQQIIDHAVCPLLGKGGLYTSLGKDLQIPGWIFAMFSDWSRSSQLREQKNLKLILELSHLAHDPEPIQNLFTIIKQNLGYYLYQSTATLKIGLSNQDTGRFSFQQEGIDISALVSREHFTAWIEDRLVSILAAAQETLHKASVSPKQVTRVFLTGGSSQVPALRDAFARLFGEEKLSSGAEFTSVAQGLALRAAELGRLGQP